MNKIKSIMQEIKKKLFKKRIYLPLLAVVDPTCPKRLALGSQNTRSKHNTTYN